MTCRWTGQSCIISLSSPRCACVAFSGTTHRQKVAWKNEYEYAVGASAWPDKGTVLEQDKPAFSLRCCCCLSPARPRPRPRPCCRRPPSERSARPRLRAQWWFRYGCVHWNDSGCAPRSGRQRLVLAGPLCACLHRGNAPSAAAAMSSSAASRSASKPWLIELAGPWSHNPR